MSNPFLQEWGKVEKDLFLTRPMRLFYTGRYMKIEKIGMLGEISRPRGGWPNPTLVKNLAQIVKIKNSNGIK